MRNRRGFTMIEVAIVVMIGAILTTIGMSAFGGISRHFSVRSAKSNFVTFQARARAQAIERGRTVHLMVDTGTDSVWIEEEDSVVHAMQFREAFDNTDIQASESVYRLCMTPRGFADPDCNSFTGTATILFVNGVDTASATIRPLGQVR